MSVEAVRAGLWDPDAVRSFVASHDLAPRVRREVTTKLETGRKR